MPVTRSAPQLISIDAAEERAFKKERTEQLALENGEEPAEVGKMPRKRKKTETKKEAMARIDAENEVCTACLAIRRAPALYCY